MASLRSLEARLARLEAQIAAIPDPEEQNASTEKWILHVDTWFLGGSLEDIAEKDREQSMWEQAVKYGPVFLKMIWEGDMPCREELLAAGVDFSLVKGADQEAVGVASEHR